MSLKIQQAHAVVPAASAVGTVPLSERVQARQPELPPQQVPDEAPQPDIDDGAVAPDEIVQEQPPGPPSRQADITADTRMGERGQTLALKRHAGNPPAGTARDAARQPPVGVTQPLPGARAPGTAVVALPGGAPAPAAAVLPEGKPAAPAPVMPVPSLIGTAPAAPQTAAMDGSGAGTVIAESPTGSAHTSHPMAASSPAARPQRDQTAAVAATIGAKPADAASAPSDSAVTKAQAAQTTGDAAPPIAGERSSVPDTAPSSTAPMTTGSSQQQGDAGTDGQAMADARRSEANVGTRQHVRAARQAEALQTAMAQRADAASQIHVSFNSWGAGHSVTARLDGGRLHMQPSSARVGQALSSATAPAGAELHIAVDSSDSATDERRRRHGSQGDA